MELKIEKERVLEAMKLCPEAEAVLKILFPEVSKAHTLAVGFGDLVITVTGEVYMFVPVGNSRENFLLMDRLKSGAESFTLRTSALFIRQESFNFPPADMVCTRAVPAELLTKHFGHGWRLVKGEHVGVNLPSGAFQRR